MRRIPGSLFVLFLLVTAIAARAEEAPSFTLGEALRNSRLIADFRLRFEQVDDDAFTRPAIAGTDQPSATRATISRCRGVIGTSSTESAPLKFLPSSRTDSAAPVS